MSDQANRTLICSNCGTTIFADTSNMRFDPSIMDPCRSCSKVSTKTASDRYLEIKSTLSGWSGIK